LKIKAKKIALRNLIDNKIIGKVMVDTAVANVARLNCQGFLKGCSKNWPTFLSNSSLCSINVA